MASNKNLRSIFSDIANAIRRKKGNENKITPINFSDEIDSIELGVFPQGKITLTDTSEYDVTQYATAQIVDEKLKPENIKKGVTILGVKGTLISGEDLYGYELDTTDVEIEYTIPSVTTIDDVAYDLVDNVKGLVKIVNGKTTKSENLFNLTADDFKKGELFGDGYKVILTLKPNTTYTLSTNESEGTNTETNIWFNGNSSNLNGVYNGTPKTTTTDENGQLYIAIRQIKIDNIFANFWIMLNEGSTALPYVPYFDGLKSVEYERLEIKGRNLLKVSNETLIKHNTISSDIALSDTGYVSNSKSYIGFIVPVKPNTTYYYKGKATNSTSFRIREFSGYPSEWEGSNFLVQSVSLYATELFTKFTTSSKTRYVVVCQWVDVIGNIVSDLLIARTDIAYQTYKDPISLLPYPTTLKGVGTARDTLEVVEQENGLYTLNKVVRCEETDYTSGDEDNANYLTNLITTIKPLATPITTTIATDLTKDEVMALLEQGGSIEVINSNSDFVNGSTTMEMVYKKISI